MPASSARRRIGLFAVLLFLGLSGLILGLTDWDRRLSTRILDLLPGSEPSVEARFLTGYVKERQSNQVHFALKPADGGDPALLVEDLQGQLEGTGFFLREIRTRPELLDATTFYLFEQRLSLFLPAWLASRHEIWKGAAGEVTFPVWLAHQTVDALEAFIGSSEGFYYGEGLTADPLLMLPELWRTLPGDDPDTADGWTSLTAELSGSAFEDTVQDAVVPALSGLRESFLQAHPGASLLMSGPVFFARSSRVAIRGEVERLNITSLLAVAAVILLVLRRPLGLLAIAPVIACGMAGGLVATVIAFDSIHVVMLVLGAFLAGITVDYGIHACLHSRDRKDPPLWKPLGAAAGTTAAGFLTLMFGTLPVVRQLGLFVGAGVLSALFAAWCLRPVFPADAAAPRDWFLRPLRLRGKSGTLLAGILFTLAFAFAGIRQIHWRDDIRELDLPSPALLAEDERIRAALGSTTERTILLTTGSSFIEAIDHWRDLQRDLGAQDSAALSSLGSLLASNGDLALARDFLRSGRTEWISHLRPLLEQRGYDTGAFAEFFTALETLPVRFFDPGPAEQHLVALSKALSTPLTILLPRGGGLHAVGSMAETGSERMSRVLDRHPETVSASQLEGLNNVFSRYRQESWRLVLAGFGVIAFPVVLLYGIRRGGGILAIPVFGVTVTFGILGWWHQDLNLFHLLAGLLGFCLALDHAFFAIEARSRNQPTPASVRLSALTTAAAFGALATSRIAAVAALGWTVTCVVLVTILLIEILGRAPPDPVEPLRS